MNRQENNKTLIILFICAVPVIIWLALIIAGCYEQDIKLFELLDRLTVAVNNPTHIVFNEYSLKAVLIFLFFYAMGIGVYFSSRENRRPGEEHGSARWGNVKSIVRRYADKNSSSNIILTQNMRLGLNAKKHRRNLNVLVVGGSGAGKTRFYAKPNLMQCNTSFIVADPKGEMLRSIAPLLIEKGYDIKVFNLIEPENSDGYKKPIRLKSLGENYTEDAIKRRLTENQKVLIVPFEKETVRVRQYRMPTRLHKVKKVGGLYGLYLHYCYKLGYLPKYKKQNTARLHYLLKEDLLKLDKITQETRLLGRENISTDEQLFSYKESVLSQIKSLTDDRTHLRKQLRRNLSDDELSNVKEQIAAITSKLWTLRKEVGLCDDIAERSKVIEANLETVRAYEEKQERKEQNRSFRNLG